MLHRGHSEQPTYGATVPMYDARVPAYDATVPVPWGGRDKDHSRGDLGHRRSPPSCIAGRAPSRGSGVGGGVLPASSSSQGSRLPWGCGHCLCGHRTPWGASPLLSLTGTPVMAVRVPGEFQDDPITESSLPSTKAFSLRNATLMGTCLSGSSSAHDEHHTGFAAVGLADTPGGDASLEGTRRALSVQGPADGMAQTRGCGSTGRGQRAGQAG